MLDDDSSGGVKHALVRQKRFGGQHVAVVVLVVEWRLDEHFAGGPGADAQMALNVAEFLLQAAAILKMEKKDTFRFGGERASRLLRPAQ